MDGQSEFALIKRYFQALAVVDDRSVSCGIGDDAAIIQIPPNMELALATDTLVAGTHFPASAAPADIGYKSLAVNLSDMAAMGAEPKWALLSLSLPTPESAWIENFAQGFSTLAKTHAVNLIGGDLNRGPLSVTVQIQGLLPAGAAIKRSGAKEDDLIYVTGPLGDAGLGLQIIQRKRTIAEEGQTFFLACLHRPEINIKAGLSLRGLAASAIDISDGLLADLGHIIQASQVGGAEIHLDKIPLSPAMQKVLDKEAAWNLALTAGDDYKLCFTVREDKQLEKKLKAIDSPCACIGKITKTPGIRCLQPDGNHFKPSGSGYVHF